MVVASPPGYPGAYPGISLAGTKFRHPSPVRLPYPPPPPLYRQGEGHQGEGNERATRRVDTVDTDPAGVIILQDRVEKRLLCRMLTHWKMLVDEILWVPGGKRFREHSLTCAAAAAMQA